MRWGLVDVDAVAVVAQAQVQLQRAECTLADPEQAGVAGDRAGHEGLRADRNEIAIARLQAERALPAGNGRMHQFRAGLATTVVEHGADVRAFEFGVGVIGVGEFHPQRFERAQVVDAATQFAAALVHHDADIALAMIVRFVVVLAFLVTVAMVVVVLFVGMVMPAGNAVRGVVEAVRRTKEAARADP